MTEEPELSQEELPWIARWSFRGIAFSFLLAMLARICLYLVQLGIPQLQVKGQVWFYVLLAVIWLPAAVGLICGYVTIIRYPYMSQAIHIVEPLFSNRNSILWRFLGITVLSLGLLVFPATLTVGNIKEMAFMIYFGITIAFVGFLIAFYRREKHVTVATLLDVTFGFAVIFVPFYLPALIIGSIRNRRFQRSLNS
jgi:hypothetical protein